MRSLLVPLLLLVVACGDDGSSGAVTPGGPLSERTPNEAALVSSDDATELVDATQDSAPRTAPERRHVDTRARLDVTGAPDGVVVELDGLEMAGVVLLPPGRRTLYVFAEGLAVGARDVDLRSGEVTVPDLNWATDALEARRKRLGRTDANDWTVDRWMEWLVAHRSRDGAWRADRFADHCPDDVRCDGRVPGVSVVETTGAALLAMLGTGETHESGSYRRVVNGALGYLVGAQRDDGSLHGDARAHAIGTLALTEICSATDTVRFREPAQRAVDALLARRLPGLGWMTGGRSDAQATAWAACVVDSALRADLQLPEDIEQGLLVDLATFGDPGEGSLPPRTAAMLTVARILLGVPEDDPAVASGIARIVSSPPLADQPSDPVQTYFATLAVFRAGGKDVWKRWNRALRDGFVKPYEAEGGLFDHGPIDSGEGSTGDGAADETARASLGRLRTVTYTYLVFQVYYRYGRVFGVTER